MDIIAKHDEVNTGITLGLNAFSDFTDNEYNLLKGLKLPEGF